MPATEVELDYGDKPLNGVVDVGHREKGVGMCHKTA